jgi:hypothetical protein
LPFGGAGLACPANMNDASASMMQRAMAANSFITFLLLTAFNSAEPDQRLTFIWLQGSSQSGKKRMWTEKTASKSLSVTFGFCKIQSRRPSHFSWINLISR